MGKRYRIWLAASIIVTVGGITWLLVISQPPELVYQGKPLDYWLTGLQPGSFPAAHPHGPTPTEANEAIRRLGTNAVPALLKMLQAHEPTYKDRVMKLLQKQHLIKIPYAPANRNQKAVQGLMALGPVASNAVPGLIALFDRDHSPFPQQTVPAIFGFIGPEARAAVPTLLRASAHTNDHVRNNAIYALGQIRADPETVVPVLTNRLSDPASLVRMQAARALGEFGVEAQPAVPALRELLRKESLVPPAGANSSFNTIWSPAWSTWIGGSDVAGIASKALEDIAAATSRSTAKKRQPQP